MEKKKSTLKINADFSNVLSKFDAELKELFPSEEPENNASISSNSTKESTTTDPVMSKKPSSPPEETDNDTSINLEKSTVIGPMKTKKPSSPPEETEHDAATSSKKSTVTDPVISKKPSSPPEKPDNDTSISSKKSTVTDPVISKKPSSPQPSRSQPIEYKDVKINLFRRLPVMQYLNATKFIALEIETDKVKYIIGKASKRAMQVIEWGVEICPDGGENRDKEIKEILSNIKAKYYNSGCKLYVSFFSMDFSLRQYVLPKVKKVKELKNAISFRLQAELPGFNENTKWYYKIIDEFSSNDTKYLRLIVIVIPGDVINYIMNLLESSGLKPEILIPKPVASYNAFKKFVSDRDADILVDLSYNITQINFITRKNIEYTRDIKSGASNLEFAIHDKKDQISGSDAISVHEGITENGAIRPEMIRKALQLRLRTLQVQQDPVLQLFKNELENSIEYFNNQYSKKGARRIFLTGYGIQKESLLSFLVNNMNLPIFVLLPQLDRSSKNALQFGQYFSTIGTALGIKDSFNLIPAEFIRRMRFKKLNYFMTIIIIMLFLGLGYFNHSMKTSTTYLKSQLTNVKKQYETLNPAEIEFNTTLAKITNLKAEQTELFGLMKKKSPVIEIMKFLSNETPQQIVLKDFSVSVRDNGSLRERDQKIVNRGNNSSIQSGISEAEYVLQFKGNVVSDYLMSDITLINYIDHLKNLNIFKEVDLIYQDKTSSRQSMSFEIKAIL